VAGFLRSLDQTNVDRGGGQGVLQGAIPQTFLVKFSYFLEGGLLVGFVYAFLCFRL
jgi:hypothetical protein